MASKAKPEKYELFKDVMEHRLRQADIRRVLDSLSLEDRDFFVDTLTGTFDKLNAVLEVTHQVSDILTLDTLFTRLVELTTEALRADRGTIFLNDPETDELFSRVAMGELTQEIRFPNHLGIAGSVFTSGQSIIIDDAYSDPRFNPEVDKKTGYRTRNILTAPIRGRTAPLSESSSCSIKSTMTSRSMTSRCWKRWQPRPPLPSSMPSFSSR